MPLSIKTRTGVDTDDKKNQMEFLKEASTYVSMITIHGRTVKQAYTGDADWDFIYEVKSNVDKHCKIIGNGGIKSYEEIETFLPCHSEQSEESSKNSLYPSLHSG